MPTLTLCVRPVRVRQISAAASAAAAIELCAATPTANDDGSAGSVPVRLTRDSAASGKSSERHSACRVSLDDACMIITSMDVTLTTLRASPLTCVLKSAHSPFSQD